MAKGMNFNMLERAAKKGLEAVAGSPSEPSPVQLYQRLQPSDFIDLIKTYGEDAVLSYIKNMEAELVKGRNL